MQDTFELYGIDHLSPSSLNAWIGCPGAWAMNYIARAPRGPANDRMRIGIVVENAIMNSVYHNYGRPAPDFAEGFAREYALSKYGMTEDLQEKCGRLAYTGSKVLHETMTHDVNEWGLFLQPYEFSEIEGGEQQFMITRHPDVDMPFHGYLDGLTDTGVILEIKTTSRTPNKGMATPDHSRQALAYEQSLSMTQAISKGAVIADKPMAVTALYSSIAPKAQILYIVDKRAPDAFVTSPNHNFHKDFALAANSLHNLLKATSKGVGITSLRNKLMTMIPMDWDHFRMSDYTREMYAEFMETGKIKGRTTMDWGPA